MFRDFLFLKTLIQCIYIKRYFKNYDYKGSCSFYLPSKSNKNVEEKVKNYIPGEYFGEISLISNSTRTGTMKCDEDSYLLTIDKK